MQIFALVAALLAAVIFAIKKGNKLTGSADQELSKETKTPAEKAIEAGQLPVETNSGLASLVTPAELAETSPENQADYIKYANLANAALNGNPSSPETILAKAVLVQSSDLATVGQYVETFRQGSFFGGAGAGFVSNAIAAELIEAGAQTLQVPDFTSYSGYSTNLYVGGQMIAKVQDQMGNASTAIDPMETPQVKMMAEVAAESNKQAEAQGISTRRDPVTGLWYEPAYQQVVNGVVVSVTQVPETAPVVATVPATPSSPSIPANVLANLYPADYL